VTVTVFVAEGCPHCKGLLNDLRRRRVALRVVDVGVSPEGLRELAASTLERRVPVVVDHERCSVGYEGRSTPLGVLGIERLAILAAEGGVSDE
jgi:glutaredoxin